MHDMGNQLTVGIFGVGLDTYWGQFPGLKERLEGYHRRIARIIESAGAVDVIDAGLVDNIDRAQVIGSLFRRQQVDIVFLYISTYALSSTVVPVVQAAGVPVIVLNIQPVAAIDYSEFNKLGDRGAMTGEWLAHCQACSVPEIAGVFNRMGIPYRLVTGYLGDHRTEDELTGWVEASRVAAVMRINRLGVIGHYYAGMLDVYTDITKQIGAFGGHVDMIEIDEVISIRKNVTAGQVAEKREEFSRVFQVSPECDSRELERAARTSVALDELVEQHHLGSMAYYYEGAVQSEQEDLVTSVIAGNTLLTGRNVPVAGEYEIKNAQAMKILDSLGAGGSFSEFYAIDYLEDHILLGHDGPAHRGIAEGPVRLVPLPLYHGKPGKGLSIQMTVRHGPVTLLSVCEGPQGVFLLFAEGESVAGPVLEIGNTNSRYRFPLSAADFIESWSLPGPSHHCAIGLGHVGDRIEKLGFLLGIPVTRVC